MKNRNKITCKNTETSSKKNYWCSTNSPLSKGVGGIDFDSQCLTLGSVLFIHEGVVFQT